jgi:hypothetical protein
VVGRDHNENKATTTKQRARGCRIDAAADLLVIFLDYNLSIRDVKRKFRVNRLIKGASSFANIILQFARGRLALEACIG